VHLIGEEGAFLWLLRGYLKAQTGSEVTAAHDQTPQSKHCATKVLKTEQIANADYVKSVTKR
jgi:hypothetical protein